jgi:hypothetical protein
MELTYKAHKWARDRRVKDALRAAAVVLVVMVVADIVGFVAWKLSGQMPADDMFIGTITKKVVNKIIK